VAVLWLTFLPLRDSKKARPLQKLDPFMKSLRRASTHFPTVEGPQRCACLFVLGARRASPFVFANVPQVDTAAVLCHLSPFLSMAVASHYSRRKQWPATILTRINAITHSLNSGTYPLAFWNRPALLMCFMWSRSALTLISGLYCSHSHTFYF